MPVFVLYINLFISKDIFFVSNILSFQMKLQKNITEETTKIVAKFLQKKVYIGHW